MAISRDSCGAHQFIVDLESISVLADVFVGCSAGLVSIQECSGTARAANELIHAIELATQKLRVEHLHRHQRNQQRTVRDDES